MSVAMLSFLESDCSLARGDPRGYRIFIFNRSLRLILVFVDHCGAYRGSSKGVNQNETAGCPVATVRIKEKGFVGFELYSCNAVHLQLVRGRMRQSIYIHEISNLRRLGFDLTPRMLHEIHAIQFERAG